MDCPHCHATEGFYTLEDGRSRCLVCFATFEAQKAESSKATDEYHAHPVSEKRGK